MARFLVVSLIVLATASCSILVSLDGLSDGTGSVDASDATSDASDATSDASDATSGASDAALHVADASLCDPLAPFETVHELSSPPGYAPYRITLTDDELDMWFAWALVDGGAAAFPIEHGKRASTDASFTLSDESALSAAVDPAVSPEGLRLFYVAAGTGVSDLSVATRADRTQPFSAGLTVPNVNTAAASFAPFLASDGALWFCSGRNRDAGDYASDVFRAAPTANGGFDTPVLVSELSSPSGQGGVLLTHDLLTVYVSSNRSDPSSLGGTDIFRATRASVSEPFGAVQNVTEINSAQGERGDWISPDNCRLYFESNRLTGYDAIYVAEKTPP